MIKSLRLTNFKGFREATVPMGPLTLLVGTNASGKSNVREALQFLQGCSLGYTLAEIIGEKWGHGGVLLWQGPRGGIQEIVYRGESSFCLEAELDQGSYSIGVVRVEHNGKAVFRIQSESVDGRQIRPAVVSTIEPGVLQISEGLPWVERDRQAAAKKIVLTFGGMRFLDLVPRVMREASVPGQVLGDQGENLSSALLAIVEDPQRKEAILDWLRALTPMDVQELHFKEDLQRRVLVYLVESSGLEVSTYSASDGTLRFLALMAALLSSKDGTFFFFEEIDNGIHPTRLHVLLDVLEQASRQMGHQIVATTHNPQLVAFLSEQARQDAVLLYRRENSQTADAIPIMKLPDIGRVLEKQDLGHLFASGWLEDVVECLADEEEEPRVASASGS